VILLLLAIRLLVVIVSSSVRERITITRRSHAGSR